MRFIQKSGKAGEQKPAVSFFFLSLQGFFSVWAILRAGHLSTRHMLAPVLFLLCLCFFRYAKGLAGKKKGSADAGAAAPDSVSDSCGYAGRVRRGALILAALFTLLTLLASASDYVEGLNNLLFRLAILAACAAGLFFLFYYSLLTLFHYAGQYAFKAENTLYGKLPVFCFFLCLLCWLPYFLYEFPGIMTPDSINQFEQVIGMAPYSNHHPWTHTLLIGLLYRLGLLFTRDMTAALSFFTGFQMIFMAAAAAWLTATLVRFGVKKGICLLTGCFYALIPYHAVFAVTIWKDVLFSGAVLLFTTALFRLLFLSGRMKKQEGAVTVAVYALSGVLLCLFRSNGFYAFLLTFPFLLYAFRRRLKLMLPLHAGILALVLLVKGPVMNAYDVTQPDFAESVCIPLQQVARVICEDKKLSGEEWMLVRQVIDTAYIKELYSPGFADNMKELVRAGHPEYLEAHKGAYLKLWLSLGLRYPLTYAQAHIDQTVGYWYPDTAYTVADIDGIIANKTGVSSRPLIGGPLVVKAKEILLKLPDMLPLYGLLSSMGAMFWALLCCIAITIIKRQYGKLIVFLPGFAVILTLFIATPVSGEFRYAYSLACALPLYLILPFVPLPEKKSK